MTVLLHKKSGRQASSPQFEPRDVSSRLVLLATLGLFLGLGLSVLIAFGLLWWVTPDPRPPQPGFGSRQAEAGPRLEVSPSADRDLLQRRAEQRLQGYGSVDREARTAHIPIDRAMAILAARGWPDPDEREEGR